MKYTSYHMTGRLSLHPKIQLKSGGNQDDAGRRRHEKEDLRYRRGCTTKQDAQAARKEETLVTLSTVSPLRKFPPKYFG